MILAADFHIVARTEAHTTVHCRFYSTQGRNFGLKSGGYQLKRRTRCPPIWLGGRGEHRGSPSGVQNGLKWFCNADVYASFTRYTNVHLVIYLLTYMATAIS